MQFITRLLVNAAALTVKDQAIALALAQASRHPLAEAVRRSLEAMGVVPASLTNVQEQAGFGLTAIYEGAPVSLARGEGSEGLTTYYARGSRAPLPLRFEDKLRPDTKDALARLRDLDIDCSVASGDNGRSVASATRGLGLTAQSAMRPADKLDLIARLHQSGRKVLMVGDGLNDGPALAAGHVSMAPGSASDVGQNAADAVFLGDSLLPVAKAVAAARRTMHVVRQNFAIAIGYNLVAVPLAFAGMVTPLVAALAMSGSSIIVVANALRLRNAAR